ncbi:MAG: 2-oxoglutarate dehydrogenase E1 component, partial [Chitinophagaceae bacterium]
MKDFQFITSSHPSYIENLYHDFAKDPGSVDPDMRKFFEGFDFAVSSGMEKQPLTASSNGVGGDKLQKEFGVYKLINDYRKEGHLVAKTNPIRERKNRGAKLDLPTFGLSDNDLQTEFYAGQFAGLGKTSLKNIIDHLRKTYTSNIGIELAYIIDESRAEWLIREMENTFHLPVALDKKRRILQKLNEGVMFEKFLHTKYVGQKRFSLEGGETTIPALDAIIQTGAQHGIEEVVIGMAHRGRLNVLANIMGKTYEQIFNEFEGN